MNQVNLLSIGTLLLLLQCISSYPAPYPIPPGPITNDNYCVLAGIEVAQPLGAGGYGRCCHNWTSITEADLNNTNRWLGLGGIYRADQLFRVVTPTNIVDAVLMQVQTYCPGRPETLVYPLWEIQQEECPQMLVDSNGYYVPLYQGDHTNLSSGVDQRFCRICHTSWNGTLERWMLCPSTAFYLRYPPNPRGNPLNNASTMFRPNPSDRTTNDVPVWNNTYPIVTSNSVFRSLTGATYADSFLVQVEDVSTWLASGITTDWRPSCERITEDDDGDYVPFFETSTNRYVEIADYFHFCRLCTNSTNSTVEHWVFCPASVAILGDEVVEDSDEIIDGGMFDSLN